MTEGNLIDAALERKARAERRVAELKAAIARLEEELLQQTKEVDVWNDFAARAELLVHGESQDGQEGAAPGRSSSGTNETRARVKRGSWAEKIVGLILASGPLTMAELREALEEDRKKAGVTAFRETLARAVNKRKNLFQQIEGGRIRLLTDAIDFED